MSTYVKLRQFCQKQANSTQYPFVEGQVLAPMLVWDYQMILDMSLKRETLKTFNYGGHKVQVAFIPVDESEQEISIQCYYRDVNEYLSDYRNDKRKFQLSFVSFEALTEIETEDGVMCLDVPDDISDFESFLVNEEFKSFILELDKADERFGKVLEMLSVGHTKNEVIDSLDLKKSQGYHLIKKALEALEIFYK
ncbi:hypothetical protein [Streptococcus suis]|uniref:hypothetical protein n=2 Tax=Streptococcus suis TaxID=1307 RepID=UPI000CF7471E|nr:hypothetical protein [Streptococcus suis]HEL1978152.1 hypothetical protein [Streptococcus suis]HEM6261095.1 hypothetical protein [Streptococcus suis]HEM6418669.1 hypothetical protein [Streptococcus suis]HEM6424895.1 hypothetical protein [Streptococcus suis]